MIFQGGPFMYFGTQALAGMQAQTSKDPVPLVKSKICSSTVTSYQSSYIGNIHD